MHGKTSFIRHRGVGVFTGLADPLEATRYHSLVVEREGLPGCLEVTAETLAQKITPRSRAIMVVHFAGRPCRMPEIMALAKALVAASLRPPVAPATGAATRPGKSANGSGRAEAPRSRTRPSSSA